MLSGHDSSMTQATTESRHVPLRSGRNVRDLGGYESRFGGSVRWGRLYRGGRLDDLPDDDISTLRALGLAVVYDLRTIEERSEAPDSVPSVHVPLLAAPRLDDLGLDDMVDKEAGVQFLVDLNLRILDQAGPQIGSIMFTLADGTDESVLFHCTAGKDRTGLLAAIVLDLLGVSRNDVLTDYEMSANQHRPSDVRSALRRFTERGVPPEAVAGLLAAPRSVMEATLHILDTRYGGVDRYLAERGRVDRGAIASIRGSLLA